MLRPKTPRPSSSPEAASAWSEELGGAYRTHGGWLVAFLARRFGRDVAEDLAQETFLRLARAPIDWRTPKSVLARTALNAAQDHLRRENAQRRPRLVADGGATEGVTLPDQVENLLHREVVAQLPRNLRDVYCLSRFGGMTYRRRAQPQFVSDVNGGDARTRRKGALLEPLAQTEKCDVEGFCLGFGHARTPLGASRAQNGRRSRRVGPLARAIYLPPPAAPHARRTIITMHARFWRVARRCRPARSNGQRGLGRALRASMPLQDQGHITPLQTASRAPQSAADHPACRLRSGDHRSTAAARPCGHRTGNPARRDRRSASGSHCVKDVRGRPPSRDRRRRSEVLRPAPDGRSAEWPRPACVRVRAFPPFEEAGGALARAADYNGRSCADWTGPADGPCPAQHCATRPACGR